MIIAKRTINYTLYIFILSVAIPLAVALLLFMPSKLEMGEWVKFLPHLNGVINSATSILLVTGFIFIKNGKQQYHKYTMISAFILGTIFLISYVIYHSSAPSTHYGNEGMIKYVYFFLLITHILLAIVVVPLVLLALYFALSKKFDRHKKIVKFTFPVWLYVSITGVIVYLMISPFYAP